MRGSLFSLFRRAVVRLAVIFVVAGAVLLPAVPAEANGGGGGWHGGGGGWHGGGGGWHGGGGGWHGGGWHGGGHWRAGWGWGWGPWVGFGPWPGYFAFAPPVYTVPFVAAPPTTTVIQQAPAPPAAPQVWYYCNNPRGYYPYVSSCGTAWREVPATPPPGSGR